MSEEVEKFAAYQSAIAEAIYVLSGQLRDDDDEQVQDAGVLLKTAADLVWESAGKLLEKEELRERRRALEREHDQDGDRGE
jgi:hypothetical protein